MDYRSEVKDFLRSRRAALSPQDVGLPEGQRRRVPGLRRGEVADLASVSVEYFSRLERGEVEGVTDGVLDALAVALRLDGEEQAHLHALVRAVRSADHVGDPSRREPPRSALLHTVDAIVTPALLVDAKTDVLAANRAARALYVDLLGPTAPARAANYARWVFTADAARTFFVDWSAAADEVAATLRHAVALHPSDADLVELVADLRDSSSAFDTRWVRQRVRRRAFGAKTLAHRRLGELRLNYETLQLPGDPGLALMVYTADPGSPAARMLDQLLDGVAEASLGGRTGLDVASLSPRG